MPFHDLEQKKIENALIAFMKRERPPESVRPQLDLGFRIDGQSVELVEIRPHWKEPSVTITQAYAKATFVRVQKVWKIYWQRADLKWHAYQPHPTATTIEEFLAVVSADQYACFYG